MENKVQQFKLITEKMLDTYERKNADYGNSFENTCNKFGITASLVRMSDKMERLCSLAKNGEQRVNNESIEDTLLDLANYSIMTMMWMEENKGLCK